MSHVLLPDKEVILTFVEGDAVGDEEQDEDVFGDENTRPSKKRKGVFYNQLAGRTLLRKTRRDVSSGYADRARLMFSFWTPMTKSVPISGT